MSTDSGRGRRQFLTRKAVVAAGRRIVEADGVDGLDDRRAADAYATLWWFVLGHLSFLPATDPDRFASREKLMKESAARVGADEERVLSAYRGLDHQAVFEHGLRALVASLSRS